MRGCATVRLLPLWGVAGLLVLNLLLVMSHDAAAGGGDRAMGACCVPGAFECIDGVSALECGIAFGGIYLGDDTTCGGAECGACCLADESCVGDVSFDVCTSLGGVLEPAEHCANVDCTIGACCLASATCQEMRAVDCAVAGGLWQGANAVCGDFDQDGIDDACESCRADANNDGVVNIQDFFILLGEWGACP